MPVMKRATEELAKLGLPDLEVKKGLYGYYVNNRFYSKQTWPRVRKTVKEIINDVLAGMRPEQID